MAFFPNKILKCLLLSIALVFSHALFAEEFIVNSFVDSKIITVSDETCLADLDDLNAPECTLRMAIVKANQSPGADVIKLPKGNYKLNVGEVDDLLINGDDTKGDLNIKSDLLIEGLVTDKSEVTISGSGKYRIFRVHEYVVGTNNKIDVEIRNVTLIEGAKEIDGDGALIHNNGNLILSNVKINNCGTVVDEATNCGENKRAISSEEGNLQINNSELNNNESAIFGDGGNIRLENVIIENNTWSGDLGGAGIFLNNVNSFLLIDSVVQNNTTIAEVSSGGGLYAKDSYIVIDSSSIESNSASEGGGGIHVEGSSVKIINKSIISDNNAENNSGGGISYSSPGTNDFLYIDNVIFSANEATANGGALVIHNFDDAAANLTIKNTEIRENRANTGGGIYVTQSNSIIQNTSVIGNVSLARAGGLYFAVGEAKLEYVSVVANHSLSNEESNLFNVSIDLAVENSIFAYPVSGVSCSGNIDSLGNNIDTEATCVSATSVDDYANTLVDLDVSSGLLLADSFAIDKASCIDNIDVDLRYRFRGEMCDIGAYEYTDEEINAGVISFVASGVEFDEADAVARLELQRAGGTQGAVSVVIRNMEYGSAVAGSEDEGDYIAFSESIIAWNDGDDENKFFDIQLIDDLNPDGHKSIELEILQASNGAQIGSTARLTVTLIDEEYFSTFQFDRLTEFVNEGNDGGVTVYLSRINAIDKEASVDLQLVDGTATSFSDYDAFEDGMVSTVIFEPYVASAAVEISIINDIVYEFNETFVVSLANPVNGAISDSKFEVEVGIRDDDLPLQTGVFSFTPGTYEANEYDGSIELTITREEGSTGVVQLSLLTTNRSGIEPLDYIEAAPIIEFGHREVEKTIKLNIIDNKVFQDDLLFDVSLQLVKQNTKARLGSSKKILLKIIENENAPYSGFVTEDTRSVGAVHPVVFALIILLFFKRLACLICFCRKPKNYY